MADSGEPGAGLRHEQRRAPRFRYFGVIFVSWMESDDRNYVMGRCLDISQGGLGVEVAKRIPEDTEVRVRADWADLDSAATVRHVTQRGGAFQLGLQLQRPFTPEIVAKLVAPSATTPAP